MIPRRHDDFAVRQPARARVDEDGPFLAGRNGDRERIGAENLVAPSPWSDKGHAVGHRNADVVVLKRLHGIVCDHADVVGVSRPDRADARLVSLLDRNLHRLSGDDLTKAMASIDDGVRGAFPHDPNRRAEPGGAVSKEMVNQRK